MLLWEAMLKDRKVKPEEEEVKAETAIRVTRLKFDKRCIARTRKGTRCRAKIRHGSEYCVFHDPAIPDEERKGYAAKGGKSHHQLSKMPDGYLRKMDTRTDVGHAMDRLYREVRLEVVTPDMGTVLFKILTRILDSGLLDQETDTKSVIARSKASRTRPKLEQILVKKSERIAWRKAIENAPEAFLQKYDHQPKPKPKPRAVPRKAAGPKSVNTIKAVKPRSKAKVTAAR